MLFQDEVHLNHGNVVGYAWGNRNEALPVPMVNQRLRQTYFGALNPITKKVDIAAYDKGNGENTVNFLKSLREIHAQAKQILMFWDNASYHKGAEVKEYLGQINDGLTPENWKIHCVGFATNAPEQNPIEDAWLQGKNFLRKRFAENLTFAGVKKAFKEFYNDKQFDFHKFNWYGFT